jgi:hypothetical protein
MEILIMILFDQETILPQTGSPLSSSCPHRDFLDRGSRHKATPLSSSCPNYIEQESLEQSQKWGSTSINLPSPTFRVVEVGTRHIFDGGELIEAANEEFEFIVAHGVDEKINGYQRKVVAMEFAPIFLHSTSKILDLSLLTIKNILNGKIRRWEEIGGADGEINIHLHGGIQQHRKFLQLAQRMEISLSEIKSLEVDFFPSYDELADAATSEPLALTVGLKAPLDRDLRLLSIDGVLPRTNNTEKYPLKMPIYLHSRDVAVDISVIKPLISRLQRERNAYDAYFKNIASSSHYLPRH